jgi:hypothetical protein
MDGADDEVIGPSVAEQLFRTRDPISTAFGVLVERVAAAEKDAVPNTAYPVPVPPELVGPHPWRMFVATTKPDGSREVGFLAHNSGEWGWPDGIESSRGFGLPTVATSLPRGEHIDMTYLGNNLAHVDIYTSASRPGDESGDPTGSCVFGITPDMVVALVANAIQNVHPLLVNSAVHSALKNINPDLAPTFDGHHEFFCNAAFAKLLIGRTVIANDRAYTIAKKHPYKPLLAAVDEDDFGMFLAEELVLRQQTSGADIMASFVDLCA